MSIPHSRRSILIRIRNVFTNEIAEKCADQFRMIESIRDHVKNEVEILRKDNKSLRSQLFNLSNHAKTLEDTLLVAAQTESILNARIAQLQKQAKPVRVTPKTTKKKAS